MSAATIHDNSRWRVECQKASSGRWIEFQTYASEDESLAVCTRLLELGCNARVIRVEQIMEAHR
jgi:hypothetical protein